MSIEGRRQIESILIREEFPKGAIALNEGEVAHEIVFVGKGMLRQYYYKMGKTSPNISPMKVASSCASRAF